MDSSSRAEPTGTRSQSLAETWNFRTAEITSQRKTSWNVHVRVNTSVCLAAHGNNGHRRKGGFEGIFSVYFPVYDPEHRAHDCLRSNKLETVKIKATELGIRRGGASSFFKAGSETTWSFLSFLQVTNSLEGPKVADISV